MLILILLTLTLSLMGCTESNIPSPPYSTSQFINRSTDLNYSDLVNASGNDGKGLLWSSDLNKFEITVLQNDIDGGYASTVYLATQRTDGGDASGN